SVEALRSKSRQRPLVTARQTAMYVFRELTDLSYPSIARLFGGTGKAAEGDIGLRHARELLDSSRR
ncbi:MAG TPA: helix-turn-helix domain-containing protein, partial [Elusimicrobiota bacterium]|nr:helix-turn-helix domain-containing protein [Elusimicrobiota bacterium]